MLKAAALSSRPQPSRSPQPLRTGFIRFFSPSSVPRSSSLWRPDPRLQCIPIFPLFFASYLQYFLLPQVPSAFQPVSPASFPSHSALPSLSAFPPSPALASTSLAAVPPFAALPQSVSLQPSLAPSRVSFIYPQILQACLPAHCPAFPLAWALQVQAKVPWNTRDMEFPCAFTGCSAPSRKMLSFNRPQNSVRLRLALLFSLSQIKNETERG